MNLFESDFLKEKGINLNDWNTLLNLVGKSTYLKISKDYSRHNLSRTKYFKVLKKFKDATLVKEVKGEYRLSPYFYLRNDCSKSLATKLQKEWDNDVNEPIKDKLEHLPETITDPCTGEVFIYDEKKKRPMSTLKGWYRPAVIEDYID